MWSSLSKVIAAIVVFMAGTMVGSWRGSPTEPPEPARVSGPGDAVDYARLESIVRRAVEGRCEGARIAPTSEAAALSQTTLLGAMRPNHHEAEEEEEERLVVVEEANKQVEEALSRRVWTAEDASKLQGLAGRLDPEERDKLAMRLASAHNAAKLEIQVFPPF